MSKKKEKKITGRPSDIDPENRMRSNIIINTKLWQSAKVALATTHRDKFKTFSGMVNEALKQYLQLDDNFKPIEEQNTDK